MARTAGSVLTGKGNGLRGLIKDIRFGDFISNKLQGATGGFDAAMQLAALLQGGIPVANVANHIAASLSDGIARALNGNMSKDMQQQLQRALANALAPPGSDQSAQALVQRLRSTIATMTREVKNDAGQQSRFPGNVLDAANTARETPAPQKNNASLIDSIVADAIARLQSAGTSSFTIPANQPQPEAATASQAAALSATAQAPAQTNASDIVGRMIARALGVDALRQAGDTLRQSETPLVSATAAHSSAPQNASGTANANVSSSMLFQRLVALIEQNAASNSSANQNRADSETGSQPQFSQHLPASTTVDSTSNLFATPGASFTVSNASQATAAPAAAAYTPVDAQAVIDQIVKGFAIHTSGSTSEVRMRLQPEQLGDVSLKLSVSGGTVSASIVAQNPDVRQTLLANQHQLAASLADAGLSLGAFSVDVSGGNPDGRTAQQFQQFAKKPISRSFIDDVDSVETVEPTFGPSILNRPADPWLLNYFA